MKKLNGKLFAATLSIALMSTGALADSGNQIETFEQKGHKLSWQEAFLKAPIAETDLSSSISEKDLMYSDDSDDEDYMVKTRVAQQKAAQQYAVDAEKASSSASGFWGKVQTVFAPIANWFKTVLSSFVFVR